MKTNAITRNSTEDYVSPEMALFTMGSVRAVPYKDVTRGEVSPKCNLPPTELN